MLSTLHWVCDCPHQIQGGISEPAWWCLLLWCSQFHSLIGLCPSKNNINALTCNQLNALCHMHLGDINERLVLDPLITYQPCHIPLFCIPTPCAPKQNFTRQILVTPTPLKPLLAGRISRSILVSLSNAHWDNTRKRSHNWNTTRSHAKCDWCGCFMISKCWLVHSTRSCPLSWHQKMGALPMHQTQLPLLCLTLILIASHRKLPLLHHTCGDCQGWWLLTWLSKNAWPQRPSSLK